MPRYFTQEGFDRVKTEIIEKDREKKTIGVEVGEAAGLNCDWHDNAPFEDARRRLEMAETQIARLRESIRDAIIMKISDQAEQVAIGTTVTICIDEDEEKTFTIGAANESLPSEGLITYESPLARPILGKRVGETVETEFRGKEVEVEIIKILPPKGRYQNLKKKLYPD